MTVRITTQSYHLRYLPTEDRILLSVSVPEEQEFGVALTRRLMRVLLEALAKIASERGKTPAGADPNLRDILLDFEHSQSVANAVAAGNLREEKRVERLSAPPKLIHKVTVTPDNNGVLSLLFDDPELAITLNIPPERLHTVIETFVRTAERAGWDFPPLAGWLDASKQPVSSAGQSLN
jgi:hypothetical protein